MAKALLSAVLISALLLIASAEKAINHDIIKTVNSNSHSTWTAGVNEIFEGKSLDEIRGILGFVPNPNSPTRKNVVRHDDDIALPQNFDAATQWPNCATIGTIYNQASCGSCWAFGCVEAVQDRFCIQSNGSVQVSLSFMDEVTCGPDDGCFGGDAGDAWGYAAESGLVTAACYPYTIPTCPPQQQPCLNFTNTPACVQKCVDGERWSVSKHFLQNSYAVSSDVKSIQAEMFKNGPVEACFDVYADFVNYKSGVYQYQTGDYLGGHCVKCIGWGVQNGTPYWLCNNSWTTYWGDNGQFMILRGKDECGIEDDVVAGMVQLSN